MADKGEDWLYKPCRVGGSPTLQSGGENQQWPINGQIGYVAGALGGVPNTSNFGGKSALAHSCLGGPQHFIAGEKITSGPQLGKFAT